MFFIKVKIENKTGMYPVNYSRLSSDYSVGDSRFNENENPGSPFNAENIGPAIDKILKENDDIVKVEIIRYA
jgi:hypothetical protein